MYRVQIDRYKRRVKIRVHRTEDSREDDRTQSSIQSKIKDIEDMIDERMQYNVECRVVN